MTTNGLKAVLVSRLEDAFKKNVTLLQNRAPEVIEHSAGGEFASSAYYKSIDPEAEVIYEGVNVDGIRFQGPTVPAIEHENIMFEDRPKKRNYSDTSDGRPLTAKVILMKDSYVNYIYLKKWHQMSLYPILIFFCTIITFIPILQNGLIFSFPNCALKYTPKSSDK